MTTIKDVAKRAGVAVSTASLAINQSDRVSKETAEKVLRAAAELQYQKNGWARDLKMKKTMMIGLVLHDLSGSFYAPIIKGIEQTLHSYGYGLIACSTIGENLGTAERFLRERRVDGVVVFSSDIKDEVLSEISREKFPVVVLDREFSHPNLYSVVVNNDQGGYQAAEHLIKLGHKAIGYISGPSNNRDSELRTIGFTKCLTEHGYPSIPFAWHIKGDYSQNGGYQAAKLLLQQKTLPTGVFVSNDQMAIGALEAFSEAGIQVPETIQIIGFDDIELSRYIRPSLTTIKQPKFEIGATAAHLIIQHIQGDEPNKHTVLPTEVIQRESTGPLY
ncbi:LacI family DNA-binding transcriptional regulator [Jeotgalibacillus proteolyticus]|uniref:LacI family transcriptional regulator n=1 Tax=Jeotgalibacillus proteolyticus TaxID=2082395 RepID=A0A2S5GA94_9BACL|nr:LacI family DNA-binding transcriptional regulator [Jeotgalibacillus proteolyticus]PPA69841.1 LacI family transcriptional regulator [Jeotgalibacillus proteolyticus]